MRVPSGRHGHAWGRCRGAAAGLLLWFGVVHPAVAEGNDEVREPLRVGFSSTLFSDVNENDAKASVRAWGQAFAAERNIDVNPDAVIYKGVAAMQAALEAGSVDLLSLLTGEVEQLSDEVALNPIFVALVNGRSHEEVLLLVHEDSGIGDVEGLQGRSLLIYENPRASFAVPWMDGVLGDRGLPPLFSWVGRHKSTTRVSGVVLPVFFRQADACLVTRNAFETMVELNPQLGRSLKVVATSPEVVPVVLGVRAGYSPLMRGEVLEALAELHQSAVGQQVLTIFRSEQLVEYPPSVMESAFEILRRSGAGSGKGDSR
ncbi:MAG TPA: PhnD/SsuA/transferrin family substrate-binding protein [Kiritimatiellia bacterium]|nr:PhnD/SsuA/transferrin family substrate-binding protein [Kiritimatiellia bacterium]